MHCNRVAAEVMYMHRVEKRRGRESLMIDRESAQESKVYYLETACQELVEKREQDWVAATDNRTGNIQNIGCWSGTNINFYILKKIAQSQYFVLHKQNIRKEPGRQCTTTSTTWNLILRRKETYPLYTFLGLKTGN